MKKMLVLQAILILAFYAPSVAQTYLGVEFGSIFSLNYKNSQSENSPFTVNDGDGTFEVEAILFLAAQVNESISFYAAFEAENAEVEVYGLTIIYQPKNIRWINFEAGKFFTPFGNFLDRLWASENPLIEWPVYYKYRTGLSAFELPQNTNALLQVRGQGDHFYYGTVAAAAAANQNGYETTPGAGIRIVSQGVYPVGVHLFGDLGRVRYDFGMANGALSNPVDVNNSNGIQLMGRLSYNPFVGLNLGTSFATGVYLDKTSVNAELQSVGKTAEDFRQFTTTFNLGYSIGHLEFYSELLFNSWQSPFINEDLNAKAFYLEGKYKFLTRFYLAGRFSMIDFSKIDDSSDIDSDTQLSESWDYDVYQMEVGMGYRINRNAILKMSKLFNKTLEVREGDPKDDLLAVQFVAFF